MLTQKNRGQSLHDWPLFILNLFYFYLQYFTDVGDDLLR